MAVRYTTHARRELAAQGCSVTVYDAGTSNVSTIYCNPQGDTKANPFVWSGGEEGPTFYAAVGEYDVTVEGTALPTLQRFEVEEAANREFVGSGTAAAPSVAFEADLDTGFYRAAANTVGVAAGGINTVSIGANGLDFSAHTVGTGTAGTLMTTGSTWLTHSTAGQCAMKFLCANSATTGDYATLRIRGRSDAAGSTEGGNFSASAGANNHGNLCGVYASGQPTTFTHNSAANIVCGMHSVIDATGASSGRRWSTWIDDHSETKAAAGHYLARLSQNGTVAIDGCFTIYNGGRMPALFTFEDATAGGFLTDSGDAGSTKAGYLTVVTPAGTKKIQLVTT
jgi:hypothetical protein